MEKERGVKAIEKKPVKGDVDHLMPGLIPIVVNMFDGPGCLTTRAVAKRLGVSATVVESALIRDTRETLRKGPQSERLHNLRVWGKVA